MNTLVFMHRKPFTYKLLIVFLTINILFMSIIAPYKRAHAILPLVALTAPQILGIGSLAIASGLAFMNPDVTQAVLQDMYSKGKDLIDIAISTMTNTDISISQALWDWLSSYALNDATTFVGVEMPYITQTIGGIVATSTIANMTASGWSNRTGDGLVQTFASSVQSTDDDADWFSSYLVLSTPYSDSISHYLQWTLPAPQSTGVFQMSVDWQYNDGTIPFQIQFFDNGVLLDTFSFFEPSITDGSWLDLPNTVVGFNMIRVGLFEKTPKQLYVRDFRIADGIYGGETVDVYNNTMVGTGDIVLNPPWTKDAGLAEKNVALPIPLSGATDITTTVTAVTGVTADTLTYTNTASGTPYIPPAPIGTPKLPWYAFFTYFLDLLRAMVEYVVRLTTFLMTMQSVPALGVGEYSDVFSWVRNHTWGGINVYNAIVSLALLSMSLMIFKVVRRL